MKTSILFAFAFSALTTGACFAQAMRGAYGFSDSQVITDCKRMKVDLEERAKTLLDQKESISKKDLAEMEESYRKVSHEIKVFSQIVEGDILDAEESSAPLDVAAFDNDHCNDIAELYKMYNDEFLVRYEAVIGKHTKPMAVRDCLTKQTNTTGMLSINLNAYKTFRDNNLRPQPWNKL